MRRLMDKRHRPPHRARPRAELLSLHALYYRVYPEGGTMASVKLHTQKNVSRIQEKQKKQRAKAKKRIKLLCWKTGCFSVYSTVTVVVKATELLQYFMRHSNASHKTSGYTIVTPSTLSS